MNGVYRLDGFEFNNQFFSNEIVESRIAGDLCFVLDNDWLLPLKRNITQIELDRQGFFINRFQETGSKYPMHFDSRPNNLAG